jgi:hypothetical protein
MVKSKTATPCLHLTKYLVKYPVFTPNRIGVFVRIATVVKNRQNPKFFGPKKSAFLTLIWGIPNLYFKTPPPTCIYIKVEGYVTLYI